MRNPTASVIFVCHPFIIFWKQQNIQHTGKYSETLAYTNTFKPKSEQPFGYYSNTPKKPTVVGAGSMCGDLRIPIPIECVAITVGRVVEQLKIPKVWKILWMCVALCKINPKVLRPTLTVLSNNSTVQYPRCTVTIPCADCVPTTVPFNVAVVLIEGTLQDEFLISS